jgi:hypothetical protein
VYRLTRFCYREAGAIILKMTYGYSIAPHTWDPLVDVADRVMMEFSKDAQPGRWLVDSVPARKCCVDFMLRCLLILF